MRSGCIDDIEAGVVAKAATGDSYRLIGFVNDDVGGVGKSAIDR